LNNEILTIENLTKSFPTGKRTLFGKMTNKLKAVNEVSLTINKGEVLGLVGESGCGKSTLGRCILRLIEPTSGNIYFNDTNVTKLSSHELKKIRKNMQIIFQNPYSSLNPRLTINDTMMEVLKVHHMNSGDEISTICRFLDLVGLPQDAIYRFPYEFSGGQLQRLAIMRALILNPEFIIADEAVSALDVSIQAQILNLLLDLKEKLSITMLFITHDLSVVEYVSNRIAVMYLGNIVEIADTEALFNNTLHPYTKALISAIPIPNPSLSQERIILEGDLPSPAMHIQGCRFSNRCKEQMKICRTSTFCFLSFI